MKKIIFTLTVVLFICVSSSIIFAKDNNINVNASVDIGDNAKELLEKLASIIGVTADKIFPFYVKQAKISSLVKMISFTALFLICISGFLITFPRCHWENGNWKSIDYIAGWFTLFSALSGGFAILVIANNLSVYLNPEYEAIQDITTNLIKLLN